MNREELNNLAINSIKTHHCTILELATGSGKSRIAINMVNNICDSVFKNDKQEATILLLVSKIVHKQNWIDEINKWGGIKSSRIVIECYDSLKKYKNECFDIVILDEAHHIGSDLRLELLKSIRVDYHLIALSATMTRDLKYWFNNHYSTMVIKCSLQDAIDDSILPKPTIYLIPLKLDNTVYNHNALRFNKTIITTQQKAYEYMSDTIEYYKKKYMATNTNRFKNLWLSKAGNRLRWLSEQKEPYIKYILDEFRNYRTLTFCSSIEQSERLGKYNITSKNKSSEKNLNLFNTKRIKHITACNILNESVNLVDCRIGIFTNLNASEIISRQRTGRLLRHKKPIIIIPYFIGTREEELVNKMMEEYKEELIYKINNIKEIKL